MKKIFALLLVSVMLLGIMTAGVSAAKPALITLQDLIDYAVERGYDEIHLPYDIAVNDETTIPEGFTVIVPSNVTIDINAKIKVEGTLYIDGYMTKDSNKNIDGNYAYSKLTEAVKGQYGHDIYTIQFAPNGYYPGGYYPGAYYPSIYYPNLIAQKCKEHTNTYYTFCTTCRSYHCPKCEHLTVVKPNYPSYYVCKDCGYRCSYCSDCAEFYCYNCDSHTHAANKPVIVYPNYFCGTHYDYKTYCAYCKAYYCADCTTSHSHCNSGSYIYVPGYGYIYTAQRTCEAPIATVTPGVVKNGTKVFLNTDTEGATIYYTTNGSVPTTRSTKYTGPITVDKDMTIRAIAVKSYHTNSSVASFKYTLLKAGSFTDIAKYDGLDEAIAVLLKAGIIEDGKKFNPEDSFTYAELTALLAEFGVDMEDVEIDESVFEDKEALSYDDFVYITYRALRAYDLINTPKTKGSITIKKLSHFNEIPDASIYRAAYVSFLENGMFYDIHITPSDDARRVDLAIALAAVVENID